ncbi:MAG: TerB family tellurite resistance protein [Deltaproteobacteria bacterium]|nr:TerB family tellurite resistance protein [Deltaproteobacteria bacterium]
MAAIDALSAGARKALLETLVAIAWADREITPEEKQAVGGALTALGLVLPHDRGAGNLESGPLPLNSLAYGSLSQRERELIYLCALWMTGVDAEEHPAERSLLAQLASQLEISAERTQRLASIARKISSSLVPVRESWWRFFDALVVQAARLLAEEEGQVH